MLFSFFLTPHTDVGQRSLEDVVGIMGHQLRALGHEAVLDERNKNIDTAFVIDANRGINVMVEGFTPAWIEFMARAKGMGARFLIIASEEPTPKGFNWGTQKEMIWRQNIFPQAAAHCEGILHLVPGKHVSDWYGQFAPTAQAELGFAQTLLRPNGPEPDFDFGFYGSLTPRRYRILKRLAKMVGTEKAIKIVADFPDQTKRDQEMRRAKVIIQLRKFEEMGLVSSSRCNTSLMIGRPVVAEPHDLILPWADVIRFPQTMQGFYDNCMLARAAWKQVWSEQISRFREKMSPEFCVGEPLRKIGILKDEKPITIQVPTAAAISYAARRRQILRYGF